MNKVRAVVKAPNTSSAEVELSRDYEDIQKAVGGHFETFYVQLKPPVKQDIVLYCNTDGKMLRLAPNLYFPLDVVRGTVVVTAYDHEGETVSLAEENVRYMRAMLDTWGHPL